MTTYNNNESILDELAPDYEIYIPECEEEMDKSIIDALDDTEDVVDNTPDINDDELLSEWMLLEDDDDF